jgi:hypothetical protein
VGRPSGAAHPAAATKTKTMKAKITWIVFLFMALSLAGASKNFCGKKMPSHFATAQPVETMSQPGGRNGEEVSETPGILPVKLFVFQLK